MLKEPWKRIGNTQLIKITDKLYAKLETANPTGSIKDRPIQYIVEKALLCNEIDDKTTLVEASSGNTGISLSAIGASMGLPVKIIMPSNMSVERRQMMEAFGAVIIDAPPSDFKEAIRMRNRLVEGSKSYWSPMQFENDLNIHCHYKTTAKEILDQTSQIGKISAFFGGAGTGGTIMGVKKAFLEKSKNSKCILVVPAEDSDKHGIQGIGDGGDYLVDREVLDGAVKIQTSDALNRARLFAKQRGILIGISSGANILAAENFIKDSSPDGIVVTLICDRGERYLSLY